MSDLLIVLFADHKREKACSLFHRGIQVASEFLQYEPIASSVEGDWINAVTFARSNGSKNEIVRNNREKKCWLLASGTWFYQSNIGSGEEEELLDHYVRDGADCIARNIDGFFNLFIADSRSEELYVINDISGSYQCFFRDFDGILALSTSSLLLASLDNWTLDPIGCQEFLYSGILYQDRTFFNEVKRFEPASIHRFSQGAHVDAKRYWSVSALDPFAITGEKAIDQFEEVLCAAIQNINRVSQKPLCDVTGGYDSRTVLSSFLSAGIQPGTFVAGSADSKDVQVAQKIAKRLALPHIFFEKQDYIPFSSAKKALKFTDGEFDIFEYFEIINGHLSTVEKGYDMSVVGSFGELCRGKHWKTKVLGPDISTASPLDPVKAAQYHFNDRYNHDNYLFPPEIRIDPIVHLAEIIEQVNVGIENFPRFFQMDNIYLYLKMGCWWGRIGSSTEKIRPCITPFQLRSVVETMMQIDWRLREKNKMLKELVSKQQSVLANISLENGCPCIPATPYNAYRFFPLVRYNYNRSVSFVRRKVAGKYHTSELHPRDIVRLKFMKDPDVEGLLDPSTMKVRELMEKKQLSRFIGNAKKNQFKHNDQLRWLISLEHCLTELATIKMSSGAVSR